VLIFIYVHQEATGHRLSKHDLLEREKRMNASLYPALLKMAFRVRLCPKHISNQTDAHDHYFGHMYHYF